MSNAFSVGKDKRAWCLALDTLGPLSIPITLVAIGRALAALSRVRSSYDKLGASAAISVELRNEPLFAKK